MQILNRGIATNLKHVEGATCFAIIGLRGNIRLMANDIRVYTGKLVFREIDFTFSFDKKELKLIPPDDKRGIIEFEWKMKPLGKGMFVPANPELINEEFLIGECYETQQPIVFLPRPKSNIRIQHCILSITLLAYIIIERENTGVDKLAFTCPELNYIHPVNQVYIGTGDLDDFFEKGVTAFITKEYSDTTTCKQSFLVDGCKIDSYFGITRVIGTNLDQPPLSAFSSLVFELSPTENYGFIYRLWLIAKEFLRFLCYRRNVYIPTVKLGTPYEGGKHRTFATMYVLSENGGTELDALHNGRYIKQAYISGKEGMILSDIAQDNLYWRHFPESFQVSNRFDAARFVMITAAFEWEFKRLYPDGIQKTESQIALEEEIHQELQTHIDITTGKKRGKYKYLQKFVRSDSLQAKIIQIGKDFAGIIDTFGKRLYQANGLELKYHEIGNRLADQRNHFAHGDLDKEFIGKSLLDLIFLQFIIYAMQLHYYGIDDRNIRKAINDLFQLGINIR